MNRIRTFSIVTLGCKVNQYESEQLAALLRARGLTEADAAHADLRVVNTCSVTGQAGAKSRYEARKAVRLPILAAAACGPVGEERAQGDGLPEGRGRVILTGCWATSDHAAAARLPGVDAVVTHHENVSRRLNDLLDQWMDAQTQTPTAPVAAAGRSPAPGTNSLPIFGQHQSGRQRAFLKIQDGCDAHCTYCIIPSLRPVLWSKPPGDVLDEARRLVDSGHVEIVLTGIFLGAFGQPTALRRRQAPTGPSPLTELIAGLCMHVPGLKRLRLSSLEPGDLTDDLVAVLKNHCQVVPHFHLPLQSGSDRLLKRMHRQYTRNDYLQMLQRVHASFDSPAITTDIIVGFPGETDAEFQQTLDLAREARFIHIHAFPFSPRVGTAAARWTGQFVQSSVVTERIEILQKFASECSLDYRRPFVGQSVQLLVERANDKTPGLRHGRCERYFDVHFESESVQDGDWVEVTIDRVTPTRTHGSLRRVLPR